MAPNSTPGLQACRWVLTWYGHPFPLPKYAESRILPRSLPWSIVRVSPLLPSQYFNIWTSSPIQARFIFLPLTLSLPALGPSDQQRVGPFPKHSMSLLCLSSFLHPTSSAWKFFLYLIYLSNPNTPSKCEPKWSLPWLSLMHYPFLVQLFTFIR